MNRILVLLTAVALLLPCAHVASACDAGGCHNYLLGYCPIFGNQIQTFDAFRVGDGLSEDHVEAFTTQGQGWTSTATQPSSAGQGLGQPSIVTWSIVPDGTPLPRGLANATNGEESSDDSGLIGFLDGIHHNGDSPGDDDLTQRDWWHLVNSAFEAWDSVSGITFNYEPADDGRLLGSAAGSLGTRGDYRIGGHSIDGQISPTFLAYNYFPNNSDMVIDTDEINRWGNPNGNFQLFRNMLMHEIGHGIGLNHVVPTNQSKLMEPRISTAYDGPQFDDILGVHRLYGDANEEGDGNNTHENATMLGAIEFGQIISIGTDAEDAFVSPGETDFVSIDDNSDIDYFKFTVTEALVVDITLTPMGPTYDEGRSDNTTTSFVASAQSNLTLGLYDTNGTSIREFSNSTGLGLAEEIRGHLLTEPGDYFVRVGGLSDAAQFFRLDIFAVPEPSALSLLVVGVAAWANVRRRR